MAGKWKSIGMALSAALVVGSLAGCSGGAGNGEPSAAPTETGSASTYTYTGAGPVTDKGGELSILANNAWTTNVDLASADIVKEIVKNAGVTVNWQLLPPTNYADAVSPRLASGMDLPDIVYAPDKDQMMKYIKGGIFQPIDELYEKYGINLKKIYEEYPELKASLTTPDGHMYYVPQRVLTKNYMPQFMVNMRWLDAVGLKEPTTLDEYTEMLRKFKTEDPNQNGKADEIPLSIDPKLLSVAFGPSFGLAFNLDGAGNQFYADDSGTVHFAYNEQAYKEYLTYMNGLYKEGLLPTDFASTTADQITSRFSQNVTGTTFNFSWYTSMVFSPLFADYDVNVPLIQGLLPLKGPHGDQFYVGRQALSGIFGITKNAKDPELAFKFLDYASGEEAQTYYTWGIKGVTYEEQDGKKVFTEQGKNNDFIQKLGIGPVNLPNTQSTASADVMVAPWHAERDKEIEPFIKAPFPFVYGLPEEAEVENQVMPDISTYVEEMHLKFIMGKESLDNFDKYVATLKKMNIDQVIKGRQAQYDRYLAASKG